jgi:hypothetical protein
MGRWGKKGVRGVCAGTGFLVRHLGTAGLGISGWMLFSDGSRYSPTVQVAL